MLSRKLTLTLFFLFSLILAGNTVGQPLRIHPDNPRYFTDETNRAIYLTGSHYWSNAPTRYQKWDQYWQYTSSYDFSAYLAFMQRYHQNFTRLWALGVFHGPEGSDFVTPFQRTGPGLANDGQPKFDLNRLDQRYYDILRSMVQEARQHGIYVSIMLFEGWWLHGYPELWPEHPYHPDNNINALNLTLSQIHTLENSNLIAIQERYIRKVVDVVNDLDNIIFEIANEDGAGSQAWSLHWVNFIKNYQSTKPFQHPVGMTYRYRTGGSGDNEELFTSNADWISPYEPEPSSSTADGRKVSLLDTDHICPFQPFKKCSPGFIWMAFMRGHNPIIMDGSGYGDTTAEFEKFRRDSGNTRRFAERMNLAAMVPSDQLASSGYCLASNEEYLVYLPDGGSVSVDLANTTGTLETEWFNPVSETSDSGPLVTGGSTRVFTSPYPGESVLYLKKK